jgi:hypothetical protein
MSVSASLSSDLTKTKRKYAVFACATPKVPEPSELILALPQQHMQIPTQHSMFVSEIPDAYAHLRCQDTR